MRRAVVVVGLATAKGVAVGVGQIVVVPFWPVVVVLTW